MSGGKSTAEVAWIPVASSSKTTGTRPVVFDAKDRCGRPQPIRFMDGRQRACLHNTGRDRNDEARNNDANHEVDQVTCAKVALLCPMAVIQRAR